MTSTRTTRSPRSGSTHEVEKHIPSTARSTAILSHKQTQELINAAHRVADGGVPLGKLIREGHNDPMVARVRYEYAALLRELINQCGYTKDELLVVNIRDIIGIVEILEEM